jgi:hypothetical protein
MADIDFSLILHKHGWSTFLLNIDQTIYEILISGVLNDPFYDFTNLLLSLLNNEEEITIKWLGEPGGTKIHIVRNKVQQHLLNIKIDDFSCDIESGVMADYKNLVSFDIKLKQFMVISFYQLKKNYQLLFDKKFAEARKDEFPFELYDKLVKKITADFPELL